MATVTDANLLLGYLDPTDLLGGEIPLDPDAAARAIERHVAQPLGLDLTRAALGIVNVVNSNMMHALRYMSTERGRDPRDYALVPFGGAGPIHGAALARALEMRRMIVPPIPGCTSALGILVADLRHELVRAVRQRLDIMRAEHLRTMIAEMAHQARTQLRAEGVADDRIRILPLADLRYTGQAYELPIPVPRRATDLVGQLSVRFHREHRRRYGHALHDAHVEVVNLRVTGVGLTPKPTLRMGAQAHAADPVDAQAGTRHVVLEDGDRARVPVFHRALLRPGMVLPAPSIATQFDATVFIPPGAEATVDAFGSIVLALS